MAALTSNSAFAGLASAASSQVPGNAAPATGSGKSAPKAVAWKQALKPASFRGVKFLVASDKQDGGRRAATHEFPGRDEPYTEDLGRKARAITVEGYVLGADYMTARDALVTALEAEGPGALIVPWMPERRMVCTGYSLGQAQTEGGMARFSLTFAEAGQAAAPTGAPMPGVITGGKTDDALGSIDKVLDATVKVAGIPLPVQADTLAAMKELGANVSGMASLVRMGADIPGALTMLQNLTPADLAGLLPSEICGPFFNLAGAYTSLQAAFAPQHAERANALLALAAATPTVSTPAGAGLVRTTMAENRAALADYQRSAAVAEAARSAALSQPASRQEAIALRDQVVDAIDTVLEGSSDPDVHATFTDLRVTTVRALAEAAGNAPDVGTVRTVAVLPSLVVAQLATPDADATDQEAQILTRNRVRHPGFVPPGALEVLRGK